ncbi:hypothetical protein [Dactylosporangium darangshiense]|uniref:Uncharacterized protein n=1 Tax=Dactylosporangium darangshiense TaxID=579108 RepID=A0ABP8DBK7_9ACTN
MTALFEHALLLHRQHPDGPLPRDGEPYPDQARRGRSPSSDRDRRRDGADAAAILDAHFARPDAPPSDLAAAFDDVYVPIHRNDHIAAAALRADRERVRRTGRWLVRHGTHRNAVVVGLGLLATNWDDGDVPLIQTIGLLSDTFGALAAEALQRRRHGAQALVWLAERVAGWGRVYVVEALCRRGSTEAREWLLRHACDGDYLNGYFAGEVATVTHLHAAILAPDADDDLVDHTGRLLLVMTYCGGMGMTLQTYPPALAVLAAHAGHLARQAPTAPRHRTAGAIAENLAKHDRWNDIVRRYRAVLDRPEWEIRA